MKAKDHCHRHVENTACSGGAVSLMPIPGMTFVVTATEVRLVQDIARAYGEDIRSAEALGVMALCGVKNIGVRMLGEMALFVPVVGWLARPFLFSSSIRAVGDAVIEHYERRHPDAELAARAA